MRLVNTLVLASTNLEKFDEFRALLTAYSELEILPADSILQNSVKISLAEKYSSYLENAIAKARITHHATHYPVLADDSGLEVEALDWQPGPLSHRFAAPVAGKTQDQANIDFLLKKLQGKLPANARFVCTLALMVEGILIHTTGILEGTIIPTAKGKMGFGYDPVFVPQGANKTLAEMTGPEKNAISHRAKALRQMMDLVKTQGIVLAKA